MRPYAPRPILFLGLTDAAGYTLKRYWIDLQEQPEPVDDDWAPAMALATACLPTPARNPRRPGVGLLIQHRGRGADYVVLGWWDRENEIPLHVFVRYPGGADARWRAARATESICVWDLEVIGFERDAYVDTVLAQPDLEAARRDYLARTLAREAAVAS